LERRKRTIFILDPDHKVGGKHLPLDESIKALVTSLTILRNVIIMSAKKGGDPKVAAFELLLQPPWLIIIYSP
jgi:hypothetical protein